MSHITGTVQVLTPPMTIGPGTHTFNPAAAPGGTKFLILHFQNNALLAGDKLQVKLGYAVDEFTSADGPTFWTRPVNVYAFPAGVEITYVPAGATTGSIQLDQYGRGERHVGETGHASFSNCDPFYNGASYTEPTYDPFWYCTDPPNWQNVACISSGDVRATVARSAGMILSVEQGESGVIEVSSCSVTLVDADKVLTAGHCHRPEEALASSIIFNYQTECDGSRPAGYNPYFYKVKAVLGHKNIDTNLDYSLLQLAEAPVGIPAIQMRHDIPAAGEQVFGIHHPNGAVKKISIPPPGFDTITSSGTGGIFVPHNFHVTGGSSGSGLYDTAGRIVGVASRGNPCSGGSLGYCPTANILADLVPTPPPPVTRDVMLVFDRSGSMDSDDGFGRKKIEAARDAASLFVQLVRAGTGNRLGLVSFSTSASSPVDFGITGVTPGTKNTLVGPAPYSTGKVGALTPGGMTSIGGGLQAAHGQFPSPGANPRAILLMTDGLENTAPMVAAVEPTLGGITLHAIGFGSESSLNGALLTNLTAAHGGLYMRAGGGLALEKFFSSAFGNIFEAGVLMDPEFDLPANQRAGNPVSFRVCGEETVTAVAGWDRTDASLFLELTTPGGQVITSFTGGVETDSGRTWTFLRVTLPVNGERDGLWKVNVTRPAGGEIPPPMPALRYFINIIPSGGPVMTRMPDAASPRTPGATGYARYFYTGDSVNPAVLVRFANGSWPENMHVDLTVTRPDGSVGNILSQYGLGGPDADSPARQATLQAIEKATGKPVVNYTQTTFSLGADPENTRGLFEESGTFGRELPDLLNVEGSYTFHARATYGKDCQGMREIAWSVHVDVGIDPGRTTVTTTPLDPPPGGGECARMTFTPRDRFGNLLGPGRADSFTVNPQGSSTPTGPVTDLGNGSYRVDVCTGPDSIDPPQISVAQPGRPAVVVGATDVKLFIYSVNFACGEQQDDCCGCAPVRPGRYATEINILNPTEKVAPVLKRVIPLVLAGAAVGREPKVSGPGKPEIIRLPAHSATMDDCCRLVEMAFGAAPSGSFPYSSGILEIVSTVQLSVTAVYTTSSGGAPSIDVQQIQGRPLIL